MSLGERPGARCTRAGDEAAAAAGSAKTPAFFGRESLKPTEKREDSREGERQKENWERE